MEEILIKHCSPTLFGIKAGSLISTDCTFGVQSCKKCLSSHGLEIELLKEDKDKKLIYIYKPDLLSGLLQKEENIDFLQSLGYSNDISKLMAKLKAKLKSNNFPHEIGILLDYPLKDVIGYINNKGKNSLYSGQWQVYSNLKEARKKLKAIGLVKT